MKTLTIVLVLIVLLGGYLMCDDRGALLETNRALVLRTHEEIWSGGNLELVDELYAPEYVAHWPDGQDTDRDGLKRAIEEARSAFPDLTEEVVHIVAENDLVVTHFISRGTLVGDASDPHAPAKKIERPEIAVHRIVSGRIVEQWTVSDQLTLMKQLGMM